MIKSEYISKFLTVGIFSISLSISSIAKYDDMGKFDASLVAGDVIAHSPVSSKIFLGTPSLCILPNGTYIVSHDFFGARQKDFNQQKCAHTHVFESKDKGKTWTKIAEFQQFWGGLFLHNGSLYIMGALNEYDSVVIRKSTDGGHTWSEPTDENNGLLLRAKYKNPDKTDILDEKTGYHTSSNAVLVANGRIWRAMESSSNKRWGVFGAMMLSAPVGSDLLKASNWTATEPILFPEKLKSYAHGTWLEGNAVADKEGKIYDMLRVAGNCDNIAFMPEISPDGKTMTFNPRVAANIEGSSKKFVPRYDSVSKRYWALVNWIPAKFRDASVGVAFTRNTLALASSENLFKWRIDSVLLQSEDVKKDGFQYVDWLFDGDDIVFACRTSFFDGVEKAHNMHDSNFITFHRIEKFRERNMDSPLLK